MTKNQFLSSALEWKGGLTSLMVCLDLSGFMFLLALHEGGFGNMSALEFRLWCTTFFAPAFYVVAVMLCALARGAQRTKLATKFVGQ